MIENSVILPFTFHWDFSSQNFNSITEKDLEKILISLKTQESVSDKNLRLYPQKKKNFKNSGGKGLNRKLMEEPEM